MHTEAPANSQLEGCLKRIEEAQQCLKQMDTAKAALEEACKVLTDLCETPKQEPSAKPTSQSSHEAMSGEPQTVVSQAKDTKGLRISQLEIETRDKQLKPSEVKEANP